MFQKKRLIVVGIALALALGLTACSNKNGGDVKNNAKNGSQTEELAPEFSYVAKTTEIPEGIDAYSVVGGNGAVYGYVYDYENEKKSIVKAPIANGEIGNLQDLVPLDEEANISKLSVDAAGNVYAVMDFYPEEPEDATEEELNNFWMNYENEVKRNLVKFDANGQKVYEVDLAEIAKDADYFYPQYVTVDAQGRVYVLANGYGLLLFDENGNYVTKLDVEGNNSWISGMGLTKDGKVCVISTSYNDVSASCTLAEVDFDGKKIGEARKNVPALMGNTVITPGIDGDLLISDGSSAYEYSIEKEEATKILTWIDLDIDGNSLSCIFQSEGQLFAITNNYNDGNAELSALSKVKTEDIVKREILTFGCIYEDSSISRRIIDFNKSNEKYRIKMKTYMDVNNWSENSYQDAITNFTNDILAGNCPDIIDLSNNDIANLAKKGVLADLMPYLEKSTKIDKNDIFEKLLEVATFDGKLTYIPSGFSLHTLAGKTSIVGTKEGWTLSDLLALAKQYPNAEILEYATRDSVLSMMMTLNKRAYVDTDNATCNFDCQEFKDLLTFAKQFPEEYDYENQKLTPFKLRDNELILMDAYIYDFTEVQSTDAYFNGEPCTYIGYPTSDGGNGCALMPRDMYGISEKSNFKDAAWAFIESMIADEATDSYMRFGFSSLKSVYAQQKADALKVEYVYDENGEIMKDENGNPIYEDNYGGGWTMIGDDGETFDYNYKPVTQEEVDLVEKLLAGATAVDESMDDELTKIITEEAASFFKGDKSVDEVVSIIQNRVNLYLKENY
ncbi:MAG: extracellular solute-binding protein [Lachnospiraceae bacterium]|nr:extracellular solute-binding protein [Lachnospiraceae bacterium]